MNNIWLLAGILWISLRAEDSVQDLGATRVVAPISPSRIEQLDSAHVLQDEEFMRNQAGTLAEALRAMPGLAVRSMGPSSARPVLRGLSGEHVVVLEDGQGTGDLSATSPDHAVAIEPLSVQKIRVIQGPRVLLFSGVLAGGVIDAQTEERFPDSNKTAPVRQSLWLESASRGMGSATQLNWSWNKAYLRGEYTRRGSSDLRTPQGVLRNTDLFAYNASVALTMFFLGCWKLEVVARGYNADYGVPGGFIGAHPNGVDIAMRRQTLRGSLSYQGMGDTLKTEWHHSYYHHIEREFAGLVGAEFVTREDGARVEWARAIPDKRLFWLAGVSGGRRALEMGGYVFTPPTDVQDGALFSVWNWRASRYWELQGGLRLSGTRMQPRESLFSRDSLVRSREFFLAAFSAQVMRQIAAGQFLLWEFYRSARAPSVEELYNQGPHLAAYTYEMGSPSLLDELGHGFKTAWSLSTLHWFGRVALDATHFSRYLTPRATGDTNWSQLLPVYRVSAVRARLVSADGRIGYEKEEGPGFSLGMSQVWGVWGADWEPLPQIPPMKWSGEMFWKQTFTRYGLNWEIALPQNRVDRYEEPTRGYGIWGLSWEWRGRGKWSAHQVFLNAQNLGDALYRNHLSRVKSIMPEAGRSVRLLWQVQLEKLSPY